MPDANAQLDRTARLDSVEQEDYDIVFYPGGHEPMWDLAEDKNSIKLPLQRFNRPEQTVSSRPASPILLCALYSRSPPMRRFSKADV